MTARRSFWMLVLVAVLAAGWLSAALSADPGPITGLQVGISGTALVAAVVLAARVLDAVERARRPTREGEVAAFSEPSPSERPETTAPDDTGDMAENRR